MSESRLSFLTIESPPLERTIAVRVREGKSPGLFWLGGFKSDMNGTKAAALEGYHWVDRSSGVVRIPIERAMELVVQNANARAAAPPPTPAAAVQARGSKP